MKVSFHFPFSDREMDWPEKKIFTLCHYTEGVIPPEAVRMELQEGAKVYRVTESGDLGDFHPQKHQTSSLEVDEGCGYIDYIRQETLLVVFAGEVPDQVMFTSQEKKYHQGGPVDFPDRLVKIGLIEGRHPMPVDEYLLEKDITEKVGFHEGLFKEASQAAEKVAREAYSKDQEVIFYPTGLTTAAMAVAAVFDRAGINWKIASFDRDSGEYVIFSPKEGGQK